MGMLKMLSVGASTVITAGFDATRFFPWLDEFRPTWLNGSVDNFKAVLAQAPFHQKALARARSSLRYILISFTFVPPELIRDVEALFQVPALQGYGSTETFSATSALLPPHPRKVGSVGTPQALTELGVIDGEGRLLPAREVGGIVVR